MNKVKYEIVRYGKKDNAIAISVDRGIHIKDFMGACEMAKTYGIHYVECLAPIWGDVALEFRGWESFMEDEILIYKFNY